MSLKSNQETSQIDNAELGNVYVMTHSFFSDVVRIGCTPEEPIAYAKALSSNTPGDYTVVFSLNCSKPCQVKKQIKDYLNAELYVNEFYQVSADVAAKLFKRETLKIPISMSV